MTLDDLVSSKPETFIATITPALATRILNERMPVNRPLRKGSVERYAEDMKSGLWRLTNQALGFDKAGNLIDGQHRLWACIESETSFRTNVSIGLDESAQEVIDTGVIRTDADVLGLRTHKPVNGVLTGAARMMASVRNHKNIPKKLFLDFVEEHFEALTWATKVAPPARGITTSPFLAVIARAYYTQDHGELGRFARIVATGMPEGNGWGPALLLRKWLVESKAGSRGTVLRAEAYFKIETALRCFLKSTDLPKLYAAKEELFQLPTNGSKRKSA